MNTHHRRGQITNPNHHRPVFMNALDFRLSLPPTPRTIEILCFEFRLRSVLVIEGISNGLVSQSVHFKINTRFHAICCVSLAANTWNTLYSLGLYPFQCSSLIFCGCGYSYCLVVNHNIAMDVQNCCNQSQFHPLLPFIRGYWMSKLILRIFCLNHPAIFQPEIAYEFNFILIFTKKFSIK